MAHDKGPLRPETVALDALIKATIEEIRSQGNPSRPDAMLFMGNWHQAVPAMVILDPVLEPVDKLVWMVIMLHARETGGKTAFPPYDTIASKSNVSSTSTIARAIAILRLTRWLTLCARVRQKSGRFTGNVYILHDEPLPLSDALYLDETYMTFLTQSQEHHHARVSRVARAVLLSLDSDIRQGISAGGNESVLERRVQAAKVLSATQGNLGKGGRFFTFDAASLSQLGGASHGEKRLSSHQHQNSKAASSADDGSRCSSNYKKTTTTTTTQNSTTKETANSDSRVSSPVTSEQTLVYPPRLSDNQKLLADRYLAMVDPKERQMILDELQGRLASEQKGMAPVYDELRFLHALCKAAQGGHFVPNLGIKVSEARQERISSLTPSDDNDTSEITPGEKERSRAFAREQLAKLRATMKKDPT
jgi:Helix-turn-helix domain